MHSNTTNRKHRAVHNGLIRFVIFGLLAAWGTGAMAQNDGEGYGSLYQESAPATVTEQPAQNQSQPKAKKEHKTKTPKSGSLTERYYDNSGGEYLSIIQIGAEYSYEGRLWNMEASMLSFRVRKFRCSLLDVQTTIKPIAVEYYYRPSLGWVFPISKEVTADLYFGMKIPLVQTYNEIYDEHNYRGLYSWPYVGVSVGFKDMFSLYAEYNIPATSSARLNRGTYDHFPYFNQGFHFGARVSLGVRPHKDKYTL